MRQSRFYLSRHSCDERGVGKWARG